MKKSFIFTFLGVLLAAHINMHALLTQEQLSALSPSERAYVQDIPSWITTLTENNFSQFENTTFSRRQLDEFYEKKAHPWFLVKYTISNNNIYYESKMPKGHFLLVRSENYKKSLQKLASRVRLPNVTFLICLADGLASDLETLEGIPLFVMCNYDQGARGVLIPDFDILEKGYQVLEKKDITKYEIPWEKKLSTLIWRGSTAYAHLQQTENNLDQNDRVTLCKLSQNYPHLINAKFTILAQGAESVPSLQSYISKKIPFEKQLFFKYQILIDGNASSYSTSGWKFFSNSVIFKPDSPWYQWFYPEMQPWVHYIPVRRDLNDLAEKVQWAVDNDSVAKMIAHNARQFALTHLTEPYNLKILYLNLMKYSQIYSD